MDRKLLDYLPPVLREVLEFQAINAANEPEISIAWDALALVLANQFLDTATASGVAVWERELNIRPKDTDTLEVRKARIKALWNLELPYTLPWLKNWLTGLCGELGHEESIVDYTINIQLDYTVLPDADALAAEILDMLLMVRPANMRVLMTSFLQSYGTITCGVYTEYEDEVNIWPMMVHEMESTGKYSAKAILKSNHETKNYGTVITTAGAALIAKCILNGGKVNIKTAAAGDGGGEYYEPTVAQTALRGKKWEGDVASAAVSTTNANMIDVKITIDDSVGGFTIREMGLFDDDGTLIAICNTPDTEKVSTDGGVVADASVVSFTITPALDTVSRAEMESALAEHNTNGTSHSDIRALALNAVQQGDVYTKPEVNALVGGAVNEHNNSDTAHASIRVDLTGLDSRLKTLELKYGTNVTGSSFEVTFVTLTDVVVTGVWNEELGRIEF